MSISSAVAQKNQELLEATFQAAADKARVTTNVRSEDKKKLYSLFKQATEGRLGSDRPRPGIFDQVGRAKYDSWAALGDMSAEEAKRQYIALVNSL